MSTFITGGQSFSDIAAQYTLDPAYGVAIANYNNMSGKDIAGKKFYITVPDNWLLSQYAGKYITLPNVMQSTSSILVPALIAVALGFFFLSR